MVHDLNLEMPFVSNPKVLKIFDTSIWDENTPSTEIELSIVSPGFKTPVIFNVKRGFDKLFNCSTLGIYPVTNLKDLTDIPDGIYIIKLTNKYLTDEEFVEYNHLRQTKILGDWHKALCKLRLNDCDNLTKDIEEERKRLYQIKAYIDAAKAQVEYCNAPNEGLELQLYAKSLLDKYSKTCKSC